MKVGDGDLSPGTKKPVNRKKNDTNKRVWRSSKIWITLVRLKARKSTPPTQPNSSSDETRQAFQGSCWRQSNHQRVSKKNGGFVGRERYGLLVLGFVFRKRIATEACNESLGQPHGQHSPGAQVSPEKNCARRSHYKPWTWPPLKPWRPKITLLKKWEVVKGFP